ncbi:hypothetical protein ACFSM7_08665 [Clavibacter michiganensis subsp. tessellarius]|uniref:hypothetical protein n=1 Tax=Clavibacter tessellarius TaxID=31965 RepID=UPI00362F38EE
MPAARGGVDGAGARGLMRRRAGGRAGERRRRAGTRRADRPGRTGRSGPTDRISGRAGRRAPATAGRITPPRVAPRGARARP